MKKSKFSDSQIMAILKQAEAGVPVPELYREHGMSNATFYKWRSKYGGMDALMISRLKELEEENRQLKKMYAEERLKSELRKERSVSVQPVISMASARPATVIGPVSALITALLLIGCCGWHTTSVTAIVEG